MLDSKVYEALSENVKQGNNKNRNIEIIMQYSGFTDSVLPTYQSIGDSVGVTKQRIEQIIKENHEAISNLRKIPEIGRVLSIISENPVWVVSDLHKKMIDKKLVTSFNNVKGLLRLIEWIGVKCNHNIYNSKLESIKIKNINDIDEYFLINDNLIRKIEDAYKIALGIPGQSGIANLKNLKSKYKKPIVYNTLKNLIRNDPNTWVKERKDDYWYVFEDRKNIWVFQRIRPPIPVTSGHLFQCIRPPLFGAQRRIG